MVIDHQSFIIIVIIIMVTSSLTIDPLLKTLSTDDPFIVVRTPLCLTGQSHDPILSLVADGNKRSTLTVPF